MCTIINKFQALLTMIYNISADDLSYKKYATQAHTSFGTYTDAMNAVDGNSATCMRTHHIGRSSPDKTLWWRVDLGGVYSIYSIHIVFKNYNDFGV